MRQEDGPVPLQAQRKGQAVRSVRAGIPFAAAKLQAVRLSSGGKRTSCCGLRQGYGQVSLQAGRRWTAVRPVPGRALRIRRARLQE